MQVTKGRLYITTTSDFDTTRCQFITVISLPVMSVMTATPLFKLIVSVSNAADDANHEDTATFEQTGDLVAGR